MENKNQVNLEKFLYVLRRRFVWIIVIALLAGLLAGVATKLFVKPEYVSYAKFYVNASDNQTHLTQSDMTVAKGLVDTYIEIFKSDTFLEEIASASGVEYSPAQIRSRMSASSVSGTEIFKVSISDVDKKNAYLLVSAMAERGPQEIKRVVECGNVSVVDKPKMATEPNSIGLKRNVALAVTAAAAISFVIFFLKEIFDVTVYTEEDLTENFKYPVIGTIPSIVPQQDRQKKGKGASKIGGYAEASDEYEEKEEKE